MTPKKGFFSREKPEKVKQWNKNFSAKPLPSEFVSIIRTLDTFNIGLNSDLLKVLELFFLLLDFLLLLGHLYVALLLLHTQLLDDVAVLQLLLGQLFT